MRTLSAIVSATLVASSAVAQNSAPPRDLFADTWVATDALGRSLPTHDDVGPPRPGRTVGMFYYLWLDGRTGKVRDNQKNLDADAKNGTNKTFEHVPGDWGWWGEPLLGYYTMYDRHVIRKHAQMLENAGVDALMFDCTNVPTNEPRYLALMDEYTKLNAHGWRTPKTSFMTNHKSGEKIQTYYDILYGRGLFQQHWFYWKGKPLILGHADQVVAPKTRDFFTVRHTWAWSSAPWFGDGKDKWTWVDHVPQRYGWSESKDVAEQTSVSIAQHPTTLIGRSHSQKKQPPQDQIDSGKGTYFAEQWASALETDPEFLLITSWNEWYAPIQKATKAMNYCYVKLEPGQAFWVDQFSHEFSRDAEPMRGGFGDNYYYQTVAGIRRYKGVRPIEPVTPKPITVDGTFADWADVAPEFRDNLGDAVFRSDRGFETGSSFVNTTGRNDVTTAKVSHDADRVYFYVRTRDDLTPDSGKGWMTLFVDADNDPKTGWLGYDLAVNRTQPGSVETNVAGKYEWATSPVASVLQHAGTELELSIDRSLIKSTTFDFKWADNTHEAGTWEDFTLNGDAAPNDRFNYRAKLTPLSP